MIGTEPPESNVVSTSSLKHIEIWCREVSEGSHVEIHRPIDNSIFTPEIFNTIFSTSTPIMRFPVIFDTGASLAITPYLTYFTTPANDDNQRFEALRNGKRIVNCRNRVSDMVLPNNHRSTLTCEIDGLICSWSHGTRS
jgi:hypothetical protein